MKYFLFFGIVLAFIIFVVGLLTKTTDALFLGLFILFGCFMTYMTIIKDKAEKKENISKKK